MLETIREYAGEQLGESGERADAERRHAEFYLELAESSGLALEAEVPERYDLIVPERDNIGAALDWALEQDPELGLRLAVGIEHYWMGQGASRRRRRLQALLPGPAICPAT